MSVPQSVLQEVLFLVLVYSLPSHTLLVRFSQPGLSVEDQWLDDIRETIWYRTRYEKLASNESLNLHWKKILLSFAHVGAGRPEQDDLRASV